MLDALVFSTRTFPVPSRTKNALAEKPALFRFKRAIINCLGIFIFAFAPRTHRIARGNADGDLIKTHGTLFAAELTPGMFVHLFFNSALCLHARHSLREGG